MPSQLRHMLRAQGRDLHAEFLNLLPERPAPISIQRWSWRRVGLAALVLCAVLVAVPFAINWAVETDRINTSLYTSDIACDDQEALWLMAQAVPTAAAVPCVQLDRTDWSLNDVKAGSGFASIVFDLVQPSQEAAITLELLPACDLSGATEVSSDQPGARRYIEIDRSTTPATVTRSYTFQGGCISERFVTAADPQRMAADASTTFGYVTREALAESLSRRSDGRLRLDPP
jgi:hypothetical protein